MNTPARPLGGIPIKELEQRRQSLAFDMRSDPGRRSELEAVEGELLVRARDQEREEAATKEAEHRALVEAEEAEEKDRRRRARAFRTADARLVTEAQHIERLAQELGSNLAAYVDAATRREAAGAATGISVTARSAISRAVDRIAVSLGRAHLGNSAIREVFGVVVSETVRKTPLPNLVAIADKGDYDA